ncbi:CHAP domain-containing protein [Enterococcus faecalis]|uniref:CHAP domain-containing protein n=1 Tax=Enterococcus TaxID=1350 RepID=UPI000878B05D|nr:CHAP domain-containing protein [Enterococcus faecalis]EGO2800814.1 CHAP domain-containing protein [Enterococcus faecalis]EJB2752951.1 CHAP domain-containing protein [Enterococcus faecalis]EKZ0433638.1 CHAP domain-containing protein [Enterococcus faecalis]MCB8509251.1 CHAP domain-containing protein [Enterococcus faecalis]MCB8511719.1 CHAP domain-containing protein [Enterococcus faecalis]
MVKKSDVVNYVNSLIGKRVDMDGVYGSQCMDLTVHVMNKFFHWWPIGDAIALTTQAIPAGFQRLRVYQATDIQAGDVMIWGLGAYAQYGHTAIAVENGRPDGTFVSVDQNWVNASLKVGSSAQPVKHTMDGVWGVIRPNYEAPQQAVVNQSTQKPQNTIKGREATMFCLYQRPINSKTGKLEDNGDHWATFFCNGVNCRRLYHPDEAEVIKTIYRENNGKEIPFFGKDKWPKNAPWYKRLETVCPVVK